MTVLDDLTALLKEENQAVRAFLDLLRQEQRVRATLHFPCDGGAVGGSIERRRDIHLSYGQALVVLQVVPRAYSPTYLRVCVVTARAGTLLVHGSWRRGAAWRHGRPNGPPGCKARAAHCRGPVPHGAGTFGRSFAPRILLFRRAFDLFP